MYNPQTKGTTDYRENIDVFNGINLNERISVGDLAFTENCSARKYPTLSARYERGIVEEGLPVDCMIAKDAHIFFIANNKLYKLLNEDEYVSGQPHYVEKMSLKTSVTRYRQMVGMGSYIVIFPDGYYFNTKNESDKGQIYAVKGYTASNISYSICNSQGDGISATISNTAPVSPSDGDYWVDTSEVPHVLKRWSDTYQDWTQIPSTFTKIAASGIDENFNEMDAVAISGSTKIENATYTIYHKGTDYIVVPYLLDTVGNATESLKLERKFPDMDYVVESGNRLWGCKYGDNLNEIYACALGDFKNWNRFLGISTDSYVASRGSDGEWTGAVSYLGTPIFFKENCIETVYPSNTGAHEIQSVNINGTGVAPGAWKSIAVVDGAVYYQGVAGFYSYTGSLPKKISDRLGDQFFSAGCAGDLAGYYYVSVRDQYDWNIFTYDTRMGVWYREDDKEVQCFARLGSELYFCTDNTVYVARGTRGTKERVHWWAVTHNFAWQPRGRGGKVGGDINKNAQKVSVRANLIAGAKLNIYIAYDSSYSYDLVGTLEGDGKAMWYIYPIVPARCDHFRLKFDCDGDGCIWSVLTQRDDEN